MEKYSINIPDQTENSLVVSTLVDQLKMEVNNVNSVIESMEKLPALKASYLERVQELITGLAIMNVAVELVDPCEEPEAPVAEEPISEPAPVEPDPEVVAVEEVQ
jgi:hypothetical protein